MSEAEDLDTAWKDTLPEEYRDKVIVQESKSLNDFVKQALDAQSMLGNSVRIPSEHASEDDRKAFTDKMAKHGLVPMDDLVTYVRPKEPDHYKLKEIPVDASDIGLAQSDIDAIKIRAHTLGLSNDQFQQYAERIIDERRQSVTDKRNRHREANEELRLHWGPDAFDGKRTQALVALRRFGGAELARVFDEDPDPNHLRAWAEVGAKFEEAGLGDLETPTYLPESKQEAETKLEEIRNNPQHPFNLGPLQAGNARYEEAAAEVMRLKRITMGQSGKTASGDYVFT